MNLTNVLRGSAAMLSLAFVASVHAGSDEPAYPPRFELSGFGTLGAVTTDDKDVWFTRYGVNFPGEKDPDFSPDSLVGIQGSLRLTPYNDITLQGLVREDGDASQDPQLTLAFFRQTLAPGLSMRIGRVRVPFFMLSDSLYVNYANLWVRPPVEVYGLNPFNDLDGIDFIYHARLGSYDIEVHPYYGGGRIPFPLGKARLKEVLGVNLGLSRGDFSLHLGHGEGSFTLERGDTLFLAVADILQRTGQGGVIADLSGTHGRTSFDSVGVQWEDGSWQFIGEYARRKTNRYAASAHGWYLSLGRRFGPVMPYVVVARQTLDEQFAEARMPPGRLAAAWDLFLGSRNNAQRSLTLGARWELAAYAAVKAEVTRATPDDDAWGSYAPSGDAQTTRIGGRTLNTFSLSLDLSF
ncbi:hypothetical protein [Aromatoleum petrolei]|uniref:Porin n=1 Tax=Aromatoleum petrolei TaxID=76116 RepID=A0ABX1MTU0_9RHOO|nr:hypothetical protein [Aromatoleum petrolei]NMF91397.1 hypothetical protein [Aromatoleum petrolei]QTQ36004.1 Uncharacterized protein ToN1_18500 [Aromatoleum petrolei]